MSAVHVINAIEAPDGMETTAVEVRDRYVGYFREHLADAESDLFETCTMISKCASETRATLVGRTTPVAMRRF